jgi:cysteine desulfurase
MNSDNFVYLDNAATTQPYAQVVSVISETLRDCWGNASSRHGLGQQAKELLERSRVMVADALSVLPEEIFFTSGGTESNNLALHGAAWAAAAGACVATDVVVSSQKPPGDSQAAGNQAPGQIITTSLEHASVTKSIRNLKRLGWQADYIDVQEGVFDWDAFERALNSNTTLISVMSVQNELGYRLPLSELASLARKIAPKTLIHTDAVQAFGKLPFLPGRIPVDLASVSAHKIGGPKGVGALYVRAGTPMFTTAHGGGQERWLRSGTEALSLIAGFAEAVRITFANCVETQKKMMRLRRQLVRGLRENFKGVIINSREDGSPFIINFTLPGLNNHELLDYLSQQRIFVSTASACENNEFTVPAGTWRKKNPLPLEAAGIPLKLTRNTLRVSLSSVNTKGDIQALLSALTAYAKQQTAAY